MIVDPRQIALTQQQQEELATLAARTGQPWYEVLRHALDLYRLRNDANGHAENESFLSAATRLGLIGSLQGTPADLSSNPRHMEGFGEQHG